MRIDELILVYDGPSAGAHEGELVVQGCALCTLTHENPTGGERAEWTTCRAQLGVPIVTYHADDMPDDVSGVADQALPCIIARHRNGLDRLVEAATLDRITGGIADLRARIYHHAARRGLTLPQQD